MYVYLSFIIPETWMMCMEEEARVLLTASHMTHSQPMRLQYFCWWHNKYNIVTYMYLYSIAGLIDWLLCHRHNTRSTVHGIMLLPSETVWRCSHLPQLYQGTHLFTCLEKYSMWCTHPSVFS